MRYSVLLLCLAFAYLTTTQAAVFRRGDKISEHFKQLNLAPEEIDPDVAPLNQNQFENVYETTDENFNVNNENEILDEADNEIVDESVNEISQSVAPASVTTLAPVTVAAPVEVTTTVKTETEPTGLAKYCKCKENHCDCCREFNFPFIPVKGPGCARMSYLGNQKMSISLKYGDLTLASRTVSSKRARPICVGLPGGYSQFCGRVYGLSKAKEDFKACLGFELRADDEVEAALRVSCFKFGPEGLKVADAEPFPVKVNKQEDDDDDDIFGFGGGADDEEDEDDYEEDDDEEEEVDADTETDTDYADDEAEEDTPADADYGGFSLAGLLDELDDDDDDEVSKPSSTPALSTSNTATRTAVDAVQSKDDKGTAIATTPAVEVTETIVPTAATVTAVNAVTDQVTPATKIKPNATAKTKRSKKSNKNKKKKAVDNEGDYAYEFLNGLLDLFN